MEGSKKKEKGKGLNKTRSPKLSEYPSDSLGSSANQKRRYKNSSNFMEGASSVYTDPSGSRRNEKARNKNTSSLMEGEITSTYTESSGSTSSETGRKNNTLSFTVATSSVYTDVSGNRSNENRRYENLSSLMEGPTSSAYTDASENRSSERRRYKDPSSFTEEETSFATDASMNRTNKQGRKKNVMSFTEESSVYVANMPETSFMTAGTFTSDVLSSDENGKISRQTQPKENIRLMPFKVKDVLEMIKDNPTYRDKSPVMIKVKENDIDEIIEKQNYKIGDKPVSPGSVKQPLRGSVVSVVSNLKDEPDSFRMSTGAERGKTANKYYKRSKESSERPKKLSAKDSLLVGADRTQKIFAMPDVQAFPAVVQTGPRRRRKKLRVSSTPRRRVSRQRVHSKPRRRSRTRRRSRSRPVRVEPLRPMPRRVVRPLYRRRYLSPCTPYPMCERNCFPTPYRGINRPYYADNYGEYYAGDKRPRSRTPRRVTSDAVYYAEDRPVPGLNAPYYAGSKTSRVIRRTPSRPYYAKSRHAIANCCCNKCQEKLQFIQPGLCNKKKNVWTNEYAVIPAPQVNLIDPCEELDPAIYPRAENPCLRDGQGNPLTDCIGRPLRSPIGKRFLKFSANGSVMDTSLRGNFWTGQPPLCVKCPMPSCSCGPDTTHNWWMGCGYPIMPNMDPFYKQVIAAETANCC